MDQKFLLTTPVAFIIFNRPEQTAKVWERIREAKPSDLFIIADAPREESECDIELCCKCRELVENIDWTCTVRRNYADSNMGCGERIASGLAWVFEQAEDAIILEDDCVPSASFFMFCQEMLEKYRDREDVYAVLGTNYCLENDDGTSYYFSRYFSTWGWATWRRAWHKYDYHMRNYPIWRDSEACYNILPVKVYRDYWLEIFDRYYQKLQRGEKLTAWSYQFYLTIFRNNGLVIYPNSNLVANIGYGEGATHTSKVDLQNYEYQSTRAADEMKFPLIHPSSITANYRLDCFMMEKIYLPSVQPKLIQRVRDNIDSHLAELLLDLVKDKSLIVYGAGNIGREVIRYLVNAGVDNFGVAVSNKTGASERVLGIEISQLDEFYSLRDRAIVLISVAKENQRYLKENAKKHGFYHYITAFDLY